MPSMEGGGVEKNLIIISNYLSKKIKNIALITFDKKFKKNFNKKIEILSPKKFKKKTYSKYFKYLICIFILLNEIILKKNIIVFSFQANIYCIILCKIFGIKIISRSNSSPSGWNKNYIKSFIFKYFFKKCDLVIVNSIEFKKQIKNVFNKSSQLIYNPLNKKEIIKKSKIKTKFNFFDNYNGLKIINVARFTDQKDHLTLLKAFNIANKKIKCRLLIIGYGANKDIIKEFIKLNKLNKNIKLLNFTKNPFPYISKSNLLVLSSIYEGLPNVLLEAITLKKFIISTNCPTGPSEILQNGKLGFLYKMGDFEKLAKLLIKYKKNQNYKNITIKAFKSLDRFDYNKNCEKYFKTILKVDREK